MKPTETAYTAFMLDWVAGALSPGERMAACLHLALSPTGARTARMLAAVGGDLLERTPPAPIERMQPLSLAPALDPAGEEGGGRLAHLLHDDLMALKWRNMFGVKTRPGGLPLTQLLRLDPGECTPAHAHGRRDVTVVLRGAFEDETGVYRRGDIAFAEPGLRHQPRTVGDESCICLIATEPGRPLAGLLGVFGWVGERGRPA